MLALPRSNILPEVASILDVSINSKTNLGWYSELRNNWKMTIDGSDYLFTGGNANLNYSSSNYFYFSTDPEYTPGASLSGSYDLSLIHI